MKLKPSLLDLWVPILLALFSLAVSSYVGYTHERENTNGAVVILQTQQKNDHERLERIEQMVSKIYDKVAGW